MRVWLAVLVLASGACSGGNGEEEPEGSSSESSSEMSPSRMSGPPDPEDIPEQPEPEPEDEAPRPEIAAPSDGAGPMTPAIGQWVRYRVSWREGARSSTEYRIVDREDDTWWVEMTDRRGRQTRHMRMRVRPGTGGRTHEMLALSFKNGAEVREIPPRLLPMHQQQMQTWLAVLFPLEWEGRPTEDVTVPAGRFRGAFKGEQTLTFNQREIAANVWHHPEVPLTGMVKFEDTSQGGHTLELAAYGAEGARSAF